MTNRLGNDFHSTNHEEENEPSNIGAKGNFDRNHLSSNIYQVGPYEGMKFKSWEDVVSYYTRYAKKIGFSIHLNQINKSRTNCVVIG